MKLQRWDMVADYTGSVMQPREDGNWCQATDVKPLEDVAKLILISPITGDRLEVVTDLKTEGPCTVFQVGNRRESFEVRISIEEV